MDLLIIIVGMGGGSALMMWLDSRGHKQ